MAEEAWGRWGPDDQAGALNLIGPDEIRAAAALVTQGRAFTLAQPISDRMLSPPNRPRPMHFMARDGGDYAAGMPRAGGFQFADDTIVLPLHIGTHIDCLCHCWTEDRMYNGFPGSAVRSSGAVKLGAETLPAIVTRGVLLDFVALTGAPLPDGASIDCEMLQAACAKADVTIGKGDAVLLRTGWYEAHQLSGQADFRTEPGIDVEAALLLAEAGAAIIGADNYAIEAMPFPEGQIFPVHQCLIRDHGIPLLEGLVLDALGEAGATTFLFMAAALPVVGGTGSPLTPVAVL